MAYLKPGDAAVYSQHAFAVYPLATHARGREGIEVPARDLGHDLPAMRAAITPRTRVLFVANPNNPTGTWISPARSARRSSTRCRATCWSCSTRPTTNTSSLPTVPTASAGSRAIRIFCVSRSFSKAYGLAALRIGYGVMSADVADMMNRVRQPFNVNALAQAAAVAALEDTAYVDESRALNRAGPRAALRRVRGARPSVRALARQLRAREGRRRRAHQQRAAAQGRHRAAGRELRAARVAAHLGRAAGGERAVPRAAARDPSGASVRIREARRRRRRPHRRLAARWR